MWRRFVNRKKQALMAGEAVPPVVAERPIEQLEILGAQVDRPVAFLDEISILSSVPTIHQIGVGVNHALTIRAPGRTTQLVCHDLSIPRNAGDIKMKINFTDPLTSGYLVAEVSPAKTASECVEALISNGCLGPGSYVLVANNKTLMPDQTLGEAGIADGSTVAIQKMERGASWNETAGTPCITVRCTSQTRTRWYTRRLRDAT